MGCPESFTEPKRIYRIAKQKGMSLVTITDHNRIEGALEIAHLPDTFISEEVTSFFPEDKCKVHVLVYQISEQQHADIQKARQNLYDLVDYLQQQNILHVLAHAHYALNDRLTIENFEKLLLLFKNFELNGECSAEANRSLKQILTGLTQADIAQMAEKHRLAVKIPKPWQKNLVGGSDDHSSLNIARAYTEVADADSVSSFLNGIGRNQSKVKKSPSSPQNMAHNIYSVAYQFYADKFDLQRHVHKDILLEMINSYLGPHGDAGSNFLRNLYFLWQQKRGRKNSGRLPQTSYDLVRKETLKLIREDPSILSFNNNGQKHRKSRDRLWYEAINRITNQVLSQFANQMMDQISGANILNILNTLASAGGMYTLLAPYFVAFSLHARQRQFVQTLKRRFPDDSVRNTHRVDPPCTAVFADSHKALKNVVFGARADGQPRPRHFKNIIGITCDNELRTPYAFDIQNFKPVGVYDFSDTPGLQLYYPPVIDMLNFCHEQNVRRIHVLTPGPLGLAGLLISHVLKLPIDSTYQFALPDYVRCITKDESLERIFRRYASWFYSQMDCVYATSTQKANKMIQEGIEPQKIKIVGTDKDTTKMRQFSGNGFIKRRLQIPGSWWVHDDAYALKTAT